MVHNTYTVLTPLNDHPVGDWKKAEWLCILNVTRATCPGRRSRSNSSASSSPKPMGIMASHAFAMLSLHPPLVRSPYIRLDPLPSFSRRTFYRPTNWGGVGWGVIAFVTTARHDVMLRYAFVTTARHDGRLRYAFVTTARHDMM